MKKCLKYFLCFLFIVAFLNKSDHKVSLNLQDYNNTFDQFTQLDQTNNGNAIQNETHSHFVFSEIFFPKCNLKKPFLDFTGTSLFQKELFYSFSVSLKEKILNNTLLYFDTIQIIFPFHSFW